MKIQPGNGMAWHAGDRLGCARPKPGTQACARQSPVAIPSLWGVIKPS